MIVGMMMKIILSVFPQNMMTIWARCRQKDQFGKVTLFQRSSIGFVCTSRSGPTSWQVINPVTTMVTSAFLPKPTTDFGIQQKWKSVSFPTNADALTEATAAHTN